ncbi:Flotillin-2 [Echinococcus granulosus]|uniref:Flotillin 2 n=1 Tax=Echinococcus granulosus TaxID=6210 RepID=A0A068WNB6_ECHGR|nr:Flotillin-2 [Echinococcus granulosus]CDS21618.1 flotillin 2 [Echinococcus granulosus]
MGAVYTVGPNKALVISGGCLGGRRVRTIIGGWGWAWCCLSNVQTISLEVMTLNPTCKHVETIEGVPLTVTGVAQVKVLSDEHILALACEQFLDLDLYRVENTVLQTLEGHLRAILGTLSVEAIYKDRDQFASLVREVAAPDVGRMGIEILSFTIKDVFDDVDYLNSLGRPQIAKIKRDANVGVAEAERDAGIVEAECEKARMEVRCKVDAAIAEHQREFELQKAAFDVEINQARAEADLAEELQSAKEKQLIRDEEVKVEIVEKTKKIDIEEQEVQRIAKVLEATVHEPAMAEAFRISQIAEAEKYRKILLSKASADSVRNIGAAQAGVTQAKGAAEAEGLAARAAAFANFTEAAKLRLVLDALPALAAEVCAPLAKTAEIVLIGEGNRVEGTQSTSVATLNGLGRDFMRMSATVPPGVRAVTGVDLTKVIGQIPGASVAS